MKRSFGTMINPSARGNPIARQMAALAAAAVVIQAFQRGRMVRNRLPWIIGAAAFFLYTPSIRAWSLGDDGGSRMVHGFRID